MKFLSNDGLKVVLSKIKEMFYTKTEVDEKLKSVSGGGTKIEEFYVKYITDYNKTFFLKFKIVESADLVHFYVKAFPSENESLYKNGDFIKCTNEYVFNNFVTADKYKNKTVWGFKINNLGLIILNRSTNDYYTKPITENIWVYLGGVPTSEIRK